MEPKVALPLATAREGFLNCYVIKIGRKSTKFARTLMVIISLLAIELKATPNDIQLVIFIGAEIC